MTNNHYTKKVKWEVDKLTREGNLSAKKTKKWRRNERRIFGWCYQNCILKIQGTCGAEKLSMEVPQSFDNFFQSLRECYFDWVFPQENFEPMDKFWKILQHAARID